MNPLDALLGREKHVFSTALPLDECRRRLPGGFPSFRPSPAPIVHPFVVIWTTPDRARMSLATHGQRRSAPRILRARFVPDATGTTVEAITELAPSQLALGLVVLAAFGLFGVASTASALSSGTSLPEALFPFGYGALFVLFALIWMVMRPSGQDAVLVDSLTGVLEATSVDGYSTTGFAQSPPSAFAAPTRPPTNVPPSFAPPPPYAPPPYAPPNVPSWPPTTIDRGGWRMPPRHLTLFSPLTPGECIQRIGPDSGAAATRWSGSGGAGLAVAWKGDTEVDLSKSGLYRYSFRHVLRVRLSVQPNGTLIEADDTTAMPPYRYFVRTGAVLSVYALIAMLWGGPVAVLNLIPFVLLAVILMPLQFFISRRGSANQHAFLVTTLESLLRASPVSP